MRKRMANKREDEILGGSGSCVNIALEEIMQYVEFIEKFLLEVEEQECINKQIKQNIMFTNVKAHNMMEDHNNNFKEEMKRLVMLMQLKNKSDNPVAFNVLR
jgi:hypothetical protein